MTFAQRFGSALNANVHLHMLIPDGASAFAGGRARFHRAPPPSGAVLVRLLETRIRRIAGTLVRAGVLVEDEAGPFLDIEPDGAMESPGIPGRFRSPLWSHRGLREPLGTGPEFSG